MPDLKTSTGDLDTAMMGLAAHVEAACDTIDALRLQRDALLAALQALLHDIETGRLVRDTTRDQEPDWVLQMRDFVVRLQAAKAAVSAAEGRP